MTTLLPLDVEERRTAPLPEPSSDRFVPLRLGAQNVWQHNTVLNFGQGRMLNRGPNGSGKSILIGLTVPFLFDGRLTNATVPTSTNARASLRDLVLDKDRYGNRVGYSWLEFGRLTPAGAETVTIGAALKASQSAPSVGTWFFVTDKRVGRDFHLYGAGGWHAEAADLRLALGGDRVFTEAAAYQAAVDNALFGLGPRLRRLVTVLRALSRPNLAGNLSADDAGAYIRDFMEPIADRVFQQVAAHFTSTDALMEKARSLREDAARMQRVLDAHRAFAMVVLRERAHTVRGADSRFQTSRGEASRVDGAHREAREALSSATAEATAARIAFAEATAAHEAVERSDAVKAARELTRAQQDAQDRELDDDTARGALARQEDLVRQTTTARDARAGNVQAARSDCKLRRVVADDAAGPALMRDEHGAVVACLDADPPDAQRADDRILHEEKRREAAFGALDASQRLVDNAVRAAEMAAGFVRDRASTAEEALEAAELAAGEVGRERERLAEALVTWAGASFAFNLLDDEMEVLLRAVDSEGELAEAFGPMVRARVERLADRRATLLSIVRERGEVVEELRRVAADVAAQREEAPPPRLSTQRDTRDGQPFWQVVDFAPEVPPEDRAALEAALDASGLLTAVVTSDGRALAADDLDAAIVAGDPVIGHSLADVLVPVGDRVDHEAVVRVLRTIGLGRSDSTSISTTGHFSIGPLAGRWNKESAMHIGLAAREAERLRRLAELAELITAADAAVAEATRGLDAHDVTTSQQDAEIRAVPSDRDVRQARTSAAAAWARAVAADEALAAARAQLATAEGKVEGARRDFRLRVAELGFEGWADDLPTLRQRSVHYFAAAWRWISHVRQLGALAQALAASQKALDDLESELRETRIRATATAIARSSAQSTFNQLRLLAGADAHEALRQLETTRDAKATAEARASKAGHTVSTKSTEAALLEERAGVAGRAVEEAQGTRDGAVGTLQAAIDADLLEAAGWGELRPAPHAGETGRLTRLLTLSRRAEMGDRSPEEQERQRAHNSLVNAHGQVAADLARYSYMLEGEFDRPLAVYNGTSMALAEVRDRVAADATATDNIIDEDERKFFDDVMLTELTASLNERLTDAEEQVRRINAQVQNRPTRAGHRVRIRWVLRSTGTPENTRRALTLVAGHHRALPEPDKAVLTEWLHDRVAAARSSVDGALADRLTAAFDYRTWYRAEVDIQQPGSTDWLPFNSNRAALSEGERAALLHLPLFAAVSTAYDGARSGAPRLFALDEAFERIDDRMRAACFAVIVDLDLDVLMANHSMMPLYETIPCIAINMLSTEPDQPGVGVRPAVWDGQDLVYDLES